MGCTSGPPLFWGLQPYYSSQAVSISIIWLLGTSVLLSSYTISDYFSPFTFLWHSLFPPAMLLSTWNWIFCINSGSIQSWLGALDPLSTSSTLPVIIECIMAQTATAWIRTMQESWSFGIGWLWNQDTSWLLNTFRMVGTFEAERADVEIVYGLVDQPQFWNPIKHQALLSTWWSSLHNLSVSDILLWQGAGEGKVHDYMVWFFLSIPERAWLVPRHCQTRRHLLHCWGCDSVGYSWSAVCLETSEGQVWSFSISSPSSLHSHSLPPLLPVHRLSPG